MCVVSYDCLYFELLWASWLRHASLVEGRMLVVGAVLVQVVEVALRRHVVAHLVGVADVLLHFLLDVAARLGGQVLLQLGCCTSAETCLPRDSDGRVVVLKHVASLHEADWALVHHLILGETAFGSAALVSDLLAGLHSL